MKTLAEKTSTVEGLRKELIRNADGTATINVWLIGLNETGSQTLGATKTFEHVSLNALFYYNEWVF